MRCFALLSCRTQPICRKGEFKNNLLVLLSFILPLAGGSDAQAAGEGQSGTLSSLEARLSQRESEILKLFLNSSLEETTVRHQRSLKRHQRSLNRMQIGDGTVTTLRL